MNYLSFFSCQMFCIVEYFMEGEDNEIEIVPTSWFDKTKNSCWWPPNTYSRTQLNISITKVLPHDPLTWIEYQAKILASFSTCLKSKFSP